MLMGTLSVLDAGTDLNYTYNDSHICNYICDDNYNDIYNHKNIYNYKDIFNDNYMRNLLSGISWRARGVHPAPGLVWFEFN